MLAGCGLTNDEPSGPDASVVVSEPVELTVSTSPTATSVVATGADTSTVAEAVPDALPSDLVDLLTEACDPVGGVEIDEFSTLWITKPRPAGTSAPAAEQLCTIAMVKLLVRLGIDLHGLDPAETDPQSFEGGRPAIGGRWIATLHQLSIGTDLWTVTLEQPR